MQVEIDEEAALQDEYAECMGKLNSAKDGAKDIPSKGAHESILDRLSVSISLINRC